MRQRMATHRGRDITNAGIRLVVTTWVIIPDEILFDHTSLHIVIFEQYADTICRMLLEAISLRVSVESGRQVVGLADIDRLVKVAAGLLGMTVCDKVNSSQRLEGGTPGI